MAPGSFSPEALEAVEALVASTLPLNFSEGETYDFTRCVRPNGSAYGTGGKCRVGTEQEKVEGYSPKKPHLGGLVNLKEEDLKFSRFDVDSAKEELELLRKGLPGKLKKIDEEDVSIEVKEKRKKLLENKVVAAEVSLSQAEKNHKFLENLKKNVSEGIELRYTGHAGIVMLSKSKNNNVITATYSVEGGFNFAVNGKYDMGQITDRREQVEIALKVKKSWDTLVRSLPVGSIVTTAAWEADGKREEREKAYMRVGFSEPLKGSDKMYSQKREDGTMAPIKDKEAIESQRNDPNALLFSERLSPKEKVKAWLQIVTGDSLLSK